ncbi:MAG: hypothetical protein SF182_27810 [Deltaproteobacteria bacterium]|nr:hypothetical protein [Deltaproteobacteria bacterium]
MSAAAARRAILLALLFGTLCRVAQYAANLSLWHDEAFVALIVRNVPVAALLGPLDWNEPSPPGFLAVEKVVVAAFGESERSLRLVPLLAAIGGLLAVARLALRACLDRRGAVCAVLLAAASKALIIDAAQVKHFSLDFFIAAVMATLAWRASRDGGGRRAAVLAWGGVAVVGLWLSYAVVFSVGGHGAVLVSDAWRRRSRAAVRALATVGIALALSAAILSTAVLAQRSGAVVEFWSAQFPPRDGIAALLVWLLRAAVAMFDQLWRPLGGLLLAPAAFGALAWWRSDRRPLLAILTLPVLGSLAAAAVGWWPFGGTQHMRFAAPALLLLAGDGLGQLYGRLLSQQPRLARAGVAAVLVPGVLYAAWHVAAPHQRHAMREAIAFMQARAQPEDRLAVFDPASFAFYTGIDMRGAPLVLPSAVRVWVVTPTSSHGDLAPVVQAFIEQLAAQRPRQQEQVRGGAAAYLFGAAGAADDVSESRR